jgi:hypothetical protein
VRPVDEKPAGGGSAAAGEAPREKLPRPRTKADWARQYAKSALEGWRRRGQFADVERYCFFIGYPRSGHSLVGSLLNAHPEILIAHELDALGYVEHHFGRAQLYALLLERDEVFASMGRKWMGYDYVVPNQFQGRWSKLRVIGDKRGHVSTSRLARHPETLDRLRHLVGVPIRVVHVTRNPYDNVATMARRSAEGRVRQTAPDLAEATGHYSQLCTEVEDIRRRLGPEELCDIVYEDFVARPVESLEALCRFLGVEAEPSYIGDSAGVVWPQVRRARDTVDWTEAERKAVAQVIAGHRVLAGYSWDS